MGEQMLEKIYGKYSYTRKIDMAWRERNNECTSTMEVNRDGTWKLQYYTSDNDGDLTSAGYNGDRIEVTPHGGILFHAKQTTRKDKRPIVFTVTTHPKHGVKLSCGYHNPVTEISTYGAMGVDICYPWESKVTTSPKHSPAPPEKAKEPPSISGEQMLEKIYGKYSYTADVGTAWRASDTHRTCTMEVNRDGTWKLLDYTSDNDGDMFTLSYCGDRIEVTPGGEVLFHAKQTTRKEKQPIVFTVTTHPKNGVKLSCDYHNPVTEISTYGAKGVDISYPWEAKVTS